MSEVILVVSGRPEQTDALVAAANRLAALTGNGRVSTLILPVPEAVATERLAADVDVAGAVQSRGSGADFIVIPRPEPEDDRSVRQAFRTALFQTDRPVLLVPPNGPPGAFGRRVVIAWRDDSRATKAVFPALRLLARAEEVHLIAGVGAGVTKPPLPPVLVEHDVPATMHAVVLGTEPFGQTLLSRAHELNADMLIMGAYAHSPLREMLLGGTTRHVVAHADLPILMRH